MKQDKNIKKNIYFYVNLYNLIKLTGLSLTPSFFYLLNYPFLCEHFTDWYINILSS